MRVTSAEWSDLDTLADMWVDLASGQRAFGSHLGADANRTVVRESMAYHLSVGGVLVARDEATETEADDDDHKRDIAGFVMFDVETGAYEQDITRGTVRNLFVVPDRRDSGIGSRLLDAAETELRDAGVGAIALDVMAANDSARRFYRRHGYSPHRIELEKSMENDTHSKEDG
ncbi:GNAT family N-acetyltransferase [Haloferax mediterranei ATCC 33500]|uniref:GNAT family N-acetyltransferase n=1 Tax=Haloferax mediterranei (strain ATCC 33500 / DSM 1411 / JCM 8866 / NBRC 14739 / NCIMB 2177 / R-4) TaxID=523841 RepID=I3R8D0_HALMT|nr:GNAT family N-acetyltransferase [Haloferax mediterranei]AFK20490.1 sporulation regulator-like protein [Haloferax mediterranei ATCC 33500]AHZ23850.1 sporulation protein [Haloferax mediterranei ATCC 33500]ELZ98274.1 sporulation regulator-like protein [Haloferax mediterranei ATCC 33500]MDX5986754.1 GNAT family N-acetyltransferase [Haloferax mediterranei ATCC 33500]QCQ76078.1 GNAT family N-acetyltransferase [Haloferax mediterranei ATCC 33500]